MPASRYRDSEAVHILVAWHEIQTESGLGYNSIEAINACIEAWRENKCRHYSISHKKSYSIKDLAKMFKTKITYLKPRSGERYASALTKISNNRKIINKYGKIDLKDYVTSFIKGEKL